MKLKKLIFILPMLLKLPLYFFSCSKLMPNRVNSHVMSSTIANRHVNVKSKCWKTKWKRRFFYSRSKREKHTCDRHSKDEAIYFVMSFDRMTVRRNFELLLIFEPITIVYIIIQESEWCQSLKDLLKVGISSHSLTIVRR